MNYKTCFSGKFFSCLLVTAASETLLIGTDSIVIAHVFFTSTLLKINAFVQALRMYHCEHYQVVSLDFHSRVDHLWQER